jgi:hypothetical protein
LHRNGAALAAVHRPEGGHWNAELISFQREVASDPAQLLEPVGDAPR